MRIIAVSLSAKVKMYQTRFQAFTAIPAERQYDFLVVFYPGYLCHQAAKGVVMPCGWEGNRRSGVALAMRHRLQWFIHLQAHGLRKGDEHLAYTIHRVRHTLPLRWRRGVVVSGIRRMNEVNPRWARLVLRWVTAFGRVYRLGM